MRILKYSKEIAALQQIETQKQGKRQHGISKPKRDKLATQCERCFKWYHELSAPDVVKTQEGERIESEIVPLCQICFKKALRKERQRQLIMGGIGEGITTEVEYKLWKNRNEKKHKLSKPISSKVFFEKISKGNRRLRRTNTLSDVLVKNSSYVDTKKFKRECDKRGITVKEIIAMTNKKMRAIMEKENEEFLE